MDYFQSHVVTLEEYLSIKQWKALDKKVAKQIRESRRKERQNKQARIKTLIALTIVEKQDKN